MGFWNSIWKSKSSDGQQICRLGRFSDSNKSKEHYANWDKSIESFEKGNYENSIRFLLDYLRNNEDNNLFISEEKPHLKFELYQGSKVLKAEVLPHLFRAEVLIADCNELNIGFLRQAIESSFDLNYGRYALNDQNQLCLIFDSLLPEASPYKLYYGMKEIAVAADEDDDILLQEFDQLRAINTQHTILLKENWVVAKLQWLKNLLRHTLRDDVLGPLNQSRFPGALSYIYLSALYKIDYFVKPEGKVMKMIAELHQNYFNMANTDLANRIQILKKGIEEITDISDVDLSKEMYDVISTFGLTNPVKHVTIQNIIDNELKSMVWYEENKHFFICEAICDYIAGYCLYNFAMPEPVQELFQFYVELSEPALLKKLDYDLPSADQDGNINIKEVKKRIDEIIQDAGEKYPGLQFLLPASFDSRLSFFKAFIMSIRNLNL